MLNYNESFDPPAPYLQVRVANILQTKRYETMPGLLDTGSDITAVPHRLVNSLQLYPIGQLQLEDVEASTSIVFTYATQLTFAELDSVSDIVIPRVEVILTGLDFAVIGRDILNLFYLRLNGPELTFDLKR
jgi:hypothetical protein